MELVEYLRDSSFATKILILSELSSTDQRILGLSGGADDYLPKPFSPAELILRVKRLTATVKVFARDSVQFGKLRLYPAEGLLEIEGIKKTLRRRETAILLCLMQHKNQVVSREMLISIVWSGEGNIPCYSTLDVYVRRLRIILGSQSGIIQTVRGFGYRLREKKE